MAKKLTWENRVQELEAEGLTRSDAQGVADVEFNLVHRHEARHTPTPWDFTNINEDEIEITDDCGSRVCKLSFARADYPIEPTMEFIQTAVNAHDELIELLKDAQVRIFMHDGYSELYQKISKALDRAEKGS